MITKRFYILVNLVFYNANAYTTVRTPKTSTSLSSEGRKSFLPDLSDLAKPLEGLFGPSRSDDSTTLSPPVTFTSTPEGLVLQAKRVLNSDLGLLDPSLLDDERFEWVSPTVDTPLDKTDYLAAGRFFDLRAAFPDLNYRAHDFRIDDDDDDATVRCTCRITGTMRGALRLRDVILSPTGKTMICPPEGFSMTFDPDSGKLVKLCTGFAMDRLVGNTQGTTGVVAAAITGGQPISDWDIYPPATVLKRFFGRPVKPLPEVSNFLAPFPETVMIQLAKGIIGSNMASVDPSLLAFSFTYMTPSLGPIGKKEFLEYYAKEEFQDVDPRISNYRVDPYDPERVWVDLKPVGAGYQGAPQAMSFTFDGDGFCTRITAGAVLDPTIGNGGGLGGPEGLRYARGQASNPLTTRPLPRLLARIKNDALAPLLGVAQKTSTVQTEVSAPNVQVPQARRPSAPSASQEKQLTPLEKLSASVGGSINLSNPVKEEKIPPLARKSSSVKEQSPPPSKSLPVIKPPPPKSPPQAVKSRPTPPTPPKSAASFPTKSLTLPLGSINIRTPPTPSSPSKVASSITKNAADKAAQAKQEQKRKEADEAAKKQMLAKAAEQAARKKEEARKAESARIEMEQKKEAARRSSEAKAKQEKIKRDQEAVREQLAAEAKAKKAAEAAKRAMEQQKQAEALQKKKAAAVKETEQKRRQEESLVSLNKAASRATISLFGRQDTPDVATPKRDPQLSRSAKVDKQRRDAEKDQKEREEAALATLAKAASRATINLLGLKNLDNESSKSPQDEKESPATPPKRPTSASKAPAGVPTLARWRENADGSVTGNVSGSRNFTNGEKITTSKIVRGSFASGEVVVTGSGSKYFLN